ncbi:MAG: glycosyltransferase family 2 protein [Flavobacteriales bacterium]|nr:glycosyltransferase family 2 protein [Flavobacteriales bacterium]
MVECGDYIAEAIHSLQSQDISNWELIVIDNGSTDQTVEVVLAFQDERIILIHESRKGISMARNAGIRIAKGEYLCFLDADDKLPPSSLSSRINFLTQHPEYSFCDGVVTISDESYNYVLNTYQPHIEGEVHLEMALFQPKCFSGVTWMIRRSTMDTLMFPEDWLVMEDRIFFFQLSEKGKYGHIDQLVYEIRRRHDSSMSATTVMETHYKRFMKEVQQKVLSASQQKKEERIFHLIYLKTYLKELRLLKAARHALALLMS